MNTATLPTHHRRGFAMIVAIGLVALVAMAIATVLALVRLDLRRTAESLEQAQLRQMLLAGERAAGEQLAASEAAPAAQDVAVALPPGLAADGASLKLRLEPGPKDGTAAATVEAALAGKALAQTLRYQRGPDGWQLAAVQLAPPTAASR